MESKFSRPWSGQSLSHWLTAQPHGPASGLHLLIFSEGHLPLSHHMAHPMLSLGCVLRAPI